MIQHENFYHKGFPITKPSDMFNGFIAVHIYFMMCTQEIKSRNMRWARHVACMGEKMNGGED